MPHDLTPPEACATMTELRAAIDQLDARLVAMLALRQTYIERAAILKPDARRRARRTAHRKCRAQCDESEGMRAGPVARHCRAVWRALIEASIAHEYKAFDAKLSARRPVSRSSAIDLHLPLRRDHHAGDAAMDIDFHQRHGLAGLGRGFLDTEKPCIFTSRITSAWAGFRLRREVFPEWWRSEPPRHDPRSRCHR